MAEANVENVDEAPVVAKPAERTKEAERAQASHDERAIGRALRIGLPVVTICAAGGVGAVFGWPMTLLVLSAGVLLGVIALFWASLRVLSGETELSPELQALEAAASGVDALTSRKAMLLRALKDLENEKTLGKLEEEDYVPLAASYRDELKAVLRKIDASLEPHRQKAEEAVHAHLARTGVATNEVPRFVDPDKTTRSATNEALPLTRVACPACEASNEPDARFCKGCGASLREASATSNDASKESAG